MKNIELSVPTFQPSKLSGRDLVSYLDAIRSAKEDLSRAEKLLKTEAMKRFEDQNTTVLTYQTGTLKLSTVAPKRSWDPNLLKYYDSNEDSFTEHLSEFLKTGSPSQRVLVSTK